MASDEIVVLLFVIAGLAFSVFYGFKASKIFGADLSSLPPSAKFHQFWLNFLGSALGWLLLGFGVARLLQCIDKCLDPFGLWDAILLLGGFIGVTGHLPVATVSLIQRVVQLVAKYAEGHNRQ